MTGTIDKDKLVTALNEMADEKISHNSTSGLVQYAVLTGLRDQIVRGEFDESEDMK